MRENNLGGVVSIALLAVIVLSLVFSSWSNPQIAPVQTDSNSDNPWITKSGDIIITADQAERS